ncbi:hypothetical protein AACT_1246 [Arcobacter acticola]|uniref:DUF1574 domain-containing protein n=1 Tax=Arcobacter acticola TaxID=1849015 RepID=A0A6M8EV53_9BACT|nr:hypothetical protein [Arcobacter acticola]QKE28425.1 hypothetical protein AACT_1246 [Arcobacter acticola]
MNSKKWIKIFIAYSFLCIIFIAGINFMIDPLKLFHQPYFFKDKLNSNMRLQAAGIINNYEFDSIILGTSMLENSSSIESSNILGGNFINISLSGSDFYERSFVLNYALEKNQIKKVIYSLDYSGLIESRMGTSDFMVDNFNYLYDDNYLNDFKQYLKLDSFKDILKTYLSKKANFDSPNEWFSNKSHSSRFGGIDNWFKAENNNQIKDAFKEISESINAIKNNETIVYSDIDDKISISKKYIDNYLLTSVINNPNTEFNLIIPPYSRIKNAIDAQYKKSDFIRLKESIKYLVEKSKDYPNLKIYGWGDRDFPDNIAYYKDLGHYSPEINSKMIYWIKENDGLITLHNVDNYLNIFEKKSLDYNLFEIGEKIENYLKK